MTEANAAHSASVTINIKDITNAGALFSYETWVDGRNCDLPYIKATNLNSLPPGSRFHTYLTGVSSDSGWVSAKTVGNTATSIRTQGRMGGPYANIKFNYAIELQVNGKSYVWEFLGWDGANWEGCNHHIPKQVSFSK